MKSDKIATGSQRLRDLPLVYVRRALSPVDLDEEGDGGETRRRIGFAQAKRDAR